MWSVHFAGEIGIDHGIDSLGLDLTKLLVLPLCPVLRVGIDEPLQFVGVSALGVLLASVEIT